MRWVLVSPFYRWRNWGSERFGHLPRVIQLISRNSTWHLVTQKPRLFDLYMVLHRKHSKTSGPLGDHVWSQPGVLRKGVGSRSHLSSCFPKLSLPRDWHTQHQLPMSVSRGAVLGSGTSHIWPSNSSPVFLPPPPHHPCPQIKERSHYSQAASHSHLNVTK